MALVVAYHLAPDAVPGGFLGVDVFFVLSGFLITSLLVVEAEATGGVDLARFYLRRLRRLLPAVLLLLGAVAAYAGVLAHPMELGRLREHSLWTLGYLANWRYIADGTSYTDVILGQSPLRHTWSLAIEEQFYLLLPALLISVGTLVRWRPVALRRALGALAVTGAAASAAWMAWLWRSTGDPDRGYFGTDTRAHSLLVGVALGVALRGRPPVHLGRARWLGSAGAVAIVAAVALGDERARWLHQGGFLAVAVAVGLVISTVGAPGWVRSVLSWRPLVALGMISYGVYLWHWPVLVVLDEGRTGLQGPVLAVVRLGVTLAAAAASYVVVERPIRAGRLGARLGRTAPPLVAGALAAVVLALLATTTIPPVALAPAQAAATEAEPAPSGPGRPVVIFGDSVAHTLAGGRVADFPHFTPWSPDQSPFDGDRVVAHSEARPACSFLPGDVVIEGRAADLHPFCGDWRRDLDAALAARPGAVLLVILSNDAEDRRVDGRDLKLGDPPLAALLDELLDELLALAQRNDGDLVLVALPPREGAFVRDGDDHGRRERILRDEYRRYAALHPEVRLLDLFDAICPGGDCDRPPSGFEPAWRYDGLHYSPEGAAWVAAWLTDRLTS